MQVSVDVNLECLGFIRGHCAQKILQNLVLVLQTLWKWNPSFLCNWLNMLCIMRMICFSAHHGYKEWIYELQYPSSQLEFLNQHHVIHWHWDWDIFLVFASFSAWNLLLFPCLHLLIFHKHFVKVYILSYFFHTVSCLLDLLHIKP